MENNIFIRTPEEAAEWERMMLMYNSVLKEINTKIEILRDEYKSTYRYNPIEHVTSRIKSVPSIVRKLKINDHELSLASVKQYLSDIAGVRIVCSFTSDIYRIADIISNQDDVTVLVVKNYIENPKPNGYKSYHLIVSVPIFLSDGPIDVKVEIQIRTIAMDFWASLEHKIYYKFDGNMPKYIRNELEECANMINCLDDKMLSLNEMVKVLEKEEKQEGAKNERSS